MGARRETSKIETPKNHPKFEGLPMGNDYSKITADSESDELPEEIIEQIQSLISERDAARTSLLSKSWHGAWSTKKPMQRNEDLNRNIKSFKLKMKEEYQHHSVALKAIFTKKTMQRYEDLNRNIKSFKLKMKEECQHHSLALKAIFTKKTMQMYEDSIRKIKSFKLWMEGNDNSDLASNDNFDLARELILKAIKLGAIDLTIESSTSLTSRCSKFVLPHEVLESETLVRLSVSRLTIDLEGRNKAVACPNLKFLKLSHAIVRGDLTRDLISRCPSIEEFTLNDTRLYGYERRRWSPSHDQFYNLKCLRFNSLGINLHDHDQLWKKSPCLKELVIWDDNPDNDVRICNPSLERITIHIFRRRRIWNGEFDVPNIQNLKISDGCSFNAPRLKIKSCDMEWEIKGSDRVWNIKGSDIMKMHRLYGFSLSIRGHGMRSKGVIGYGTSKAVIGIFSFY